MVSFSRFLLSGLHSFLPGGGQAERSLLVWRQQQQQLQQLQEPQQEPRRAAFLTRPTTRKSTTTTTRTTVATSSMKRSTSPSLTTSVTTGRFGGTKKARGCDHGDSYSEPTTTTTSSTAIKATTKTLAAAVSFSSSRSSSSSSSSVVQECLATLSREALSILVDSSSSSATADSMEQRTKEMEQRAKEGVPLTEQELDDILDSFRYVTPKDDDDDMDVEDDIDNDDDDASASSVVAKNGRMDWTEFRRVLKEIAHLSHKDWTMTSTNAQRLLPFWIPEEQQQQQPQQGTTTTTTTTDFPGFLSATRYSRILADGNWDGAVEHATASVASSSQEQQPQCESQPWAVLVTGVNGIRKTTSLYQPWFGMLLEEALVPPSTADSSSSNSNSSILPTTAASSLSLLPTGSNSFFRQLDHMIATLCNKEFAILYALTEKRLKQLPSDTATVGGGGDEKKIEEDTIITPEVIQAYSNLKAALFTRFRTLSELFGVLLLQQAQQKRINCLMETSGRDVAMFHYVDHVFSAAAAGSNHPSVSYRKLALHFVINDLSHAQTSVDRRMVDEIRTGMEAIQGSNSDGNIIVDISRVIHANAGGPYGSEVLPGVQEASDTVWKTVVDGSAGVGGDWYKATIQINAHSGSEPWTAQAVKPNGTLGTLYTFEKQRI